MPLRNASDVFNLYTTELISAANDASAAFDTSRYTEAVIYIRTTAKAGTTPGLTLDVEVSDDNTNWHQHSQAVVISDPTVPLNHAAVLVTNLGKWIRLNNPAAPTGSASPSLTITALLIAKN